MARTPSVPPPNTPQTVPLQALRIKLEHRGLEPNGQHHKRLMQRLSDKGQLDPIEINGDWEIIKGEDVELFNAAKALGWMYLEAFNPHG